MIISVILLFALGTFLLIFPLMKTAMELWGNKYANYESSVRKLIGRISLSLFGLVILVFAAYLQMR